MKVYKCNACRFLFERVGVITRCPDCGKERVRTATPAEKMEYLKLREEFGYETAEKKIV